MICSAVQNLSQFFEGVYLPLRMVRASQRSVVHYRGAVAHWQRLCGDVPLSQVDSATVARFQAGLAKLSPASVNSYTRPILAMLRLAADEEYGLIDRAPRVRFLKEPRRSPLALTLDEFRCVLSTAQQVRTPVAGCPGGAWWTAVLLVAWETGLRFTALLSLRSVDLLWGDCGIFCQAESQKDKESLWFPLQSPTLDALRKVYEPTRELLFPLDVTPGTVGKRFRRILDASGIYAPKGAGMRFHRLRKSKASYTELAGGDAQRCLGHSARSVTERYLDSRIVGRVKQPAMPMPG